MMALVLCRKLGKYCSHQNVSSPRRSLLEGGEAFHLATIKHVVLGNSLLVLMLNEHRIPFMFVEPCLGILVLLL
jgi:hypothetical protein